MIRAKRLEWHQSGKIHHASLGGLEYAVIPTSGGSYPPNTFIVDAAFGPHVPGDYVSVDVDDKDFYETIDAAKAACQAHADALAREIAEVGE